MAARPNVVVMLADNVGVGGLSCYGGSVPTPRLDRLAADLREANLTDANLVGAQLGDARLDNVILDRARWVDRRRCRPGSVGSCR